MSSSCNYRNLYIMSTNQSDKVYCSSHPDGAYDHNPQTPKRGHPKCCLTVNFNPMKKCFSYCLVMSPNVILLISYASHILFASLTLNPDMAILTSVHVYSPIHTFHAVVIGGVKVWGEDWTFVRPPAISHKQGIRYSRSVTHTKRQFNFFFPEKPLSICRNFPGEGRL